MSLLRILTFPVLAGFFLEFKRRKLKYFVNTNPRKFFFKFIQNNNRTMIHALSHRLFVAEARIRS